MAEPVFLGIQYGGPLVLHDHVELSVTWYKHKPFMNFNGPAQAS